MFTTWGASAVAGFPSGSSIEVIRLLKQTLPKIHVLVLTLHEDVRLLRKAMEAGAAGYTVKRAVDFELIGAIRAIQGGELYIHPSMTQALLKDISTEPSPSKVSAATLTLREQEVMGLIVKGYTNRQIAQELHLSMGTINSHRANIMSKLNLHNRVELVRYAVEHGLVE